MRCLFFLQAWTAEFVRGPVVQQWSLCGVYSDTGADRREEYFDGAGWGSTGVCGVDRTAGLRGARAGREWSAGRGHYGGDRSGTDRVDVYACGGDCGLRCDCSGEAREPGGCGKAVWGEQSGSGGCGEGYSGGYARLDE